ncbi:MAG TPA: hypothetical protein VGC13_02180 [Longimicrobium sp.]|jgi:hypothetical protein|uniref:hypothetical protein n=1 Tax=Longimicrobium sp. TaxID=2029185 RepID=UPI002EDA7490
MLIPRYWSRAESQATTPAGKFVRFHVWRGSRSSPAEAQSLADEAVGRIAERIRAGAGFPERYAYGDRPLREEVVGEFPGAAPADAPEAALTRNAYGAVVLNAARVFFIDVDVERADTPQPPGSSSSPSALPADPMAAARELVDALPLPGGVKSLLGGFFGSKPARPAAPPPPPPAPADPASAAMDRLRRWMGSHSDWRVRVYRTHSGLRYLVTHALFAPTDPQAQEAMAALGADPQYIRLCQVQKSFRARLTPKPWRIGMENPPVGFPYESAGDEAQMRAWEGRYEAASQGRATCRFVEEMGGGAEHPQVTPLRTLHDERTRATSGLPLA